MPLFVTVGRQLLSSMAASASYVAGTHSMAFVTAPSHEVAKKIAGGLVKNKLAACVDIIPGIVSVYEWKNEINEDPEVLMMIKTRTSRLEELTKNDVYSSLEEMETTAVNHAWLDIPRLNQPRPASDPRPTQESSHPAEVPTRNVGSVYLTTPSGHSTLYMGGRRTSPIHHQIVLGGPNRSPGGPRLPIRTVGDGNDKMGVRPVARPAVGNKRMPSSPAGGSSGMFGQRPPPGSQRMDWRHRPHDSKHRIQIVRQQLPIGRVRFSTPEKDSSQPAAFQQAEYQDFASVSQTSTINSPHISMGTSNVLVGQKDRQVNAENTQNALTLAEVIELAKIMDLPLEKKLLLEKDSNSDFGNAISILQQQKNGNWLSRIGQVVAGVSRQLPSIDQAVTTMSFLAFGIFMANLVLQAIANSTSLISLLGREDVGSFTWLPFDVSTFPHNLRSLETDLSLGEDDLDGVDTGMLKNVVEVISQVYISLHEMARMGVSWLSGESSIPKLLEELRAEVASQQGLNCLSLFSECLDTESVETFLTHVESEMAYNPGLMTDDLVIETGQARTGVKGRYTKQHNVNATDDSLKSSMPKSLVDTQEHFSLPSQVGLEKDKSNKNGMLNKGSETGQIT